MAAVKGLTKDPRTPLGVRVDAIREELGRPRRPFTWEELRDRWVETYGEAMSTRTMRRWPVLGTIDSGDAIRLALLGKCSVDWLLTGRGGGPGTLEATAAAALQAELQAIPTKAPVPTDPVAEEAARVRDVSLLEQKRLASLARQRKRKRRG